MAQTRRAAPRSTRAKAPTGPRVLATLDEDDLIEMRIKHRLADDTRRLAYLAASDFDRMSGALVQKYNLPPRFDVNFITGEILEKEQVDA